MPSLGAASHRHCARLVAMGLDRAPAAISFAAMRRRPLAVIGLCVTAAVSAPSAIVYAGTTAPSQELERLVERDYSNRETHRVDWSALFSRYRSQLDSAATPSQFAAQAAQLLAAAQDVHITLSDGYRVLPTFHRPIADNYSLPLIATPVPDVRVSPRRRLARTEWRRPGRRSAMAGATEERRRPRGRCSRSPRCGEMTQ